MDEHEYRGDAEGGEGVGRVGDSPGEACEEAEEGEEVGEGWVGAVVGIFGFCARRVARSVVGDGCCGVRGGLRF